MANRDFVEVAYRQPLPQIRSDRSVLQIGEVGILHIAADVAIGVSQVLGKGVRRQHIEAVREAFVQGCLERVVGRLELRVVERQDLGHIGLLREVPSPVVGNAVVRVGSAEVGVEWLWRLIEVTGLVIP